MLLYVLFNDVILQLLFNNLAVINRSGVYVYITYCIEDGLAIMFAGLPGLWQTADCVSSLLHYFPVTEWNDEFCVQLSILILYACKFIIIVATGTNGRTDI